MAVLATSENYNQIHDTSRVTRINIVADIETRTLLEVTAL